MGRLSLVVGWVAMLACEVETRPLGRRKELPDLPSTGVYEVTARVVSDSCTPVYVAPGRWRDFVDARATRDTARLEFGASAVPPETRTDRPWRRSLTIVPPQVDRHKLFMPDVPTPIGEETLEIPRYSRDGFTLAITVTQGNGEPGAPGCATRVEHEFRAVEPMCAAICTRGVKPSSEVPAAGELQRMTVECDCGDPERSIKAW